MGCDDCPLKAHWLSKGHWQPVEPVLTSSDTLVIGHSPSRRDWDTGRLFTGDEGAYLRDALGGRQTSLTTLVMCRYPFHDPTVGERLYRREGKPSPLECCSARLRADMEAHSNYITLGAEPCRLVAKSTLSDVRGGPLIVDDKKVLATLDPHDLIMAPKWKWVFKSDVAKAFRHFDGTTTYKDPEIIYNPTVRQLTQWLVERKLEGTTHIAYDVETDGIDSLSCNLRCVGLATPTHAVVIPYLSVDGSVYSQPQAIHDLLTDFFTDRTLVKVGHNSGYYDRQIIERYFDVTPLPAVDTILLHRLSYSEYPHTLAFVGSTLTDAPPWKAEHTATTARRDEILWLYNARDSAVTETVRPLLEGEVDYLQQSSLISTDSALQEICYGMHKLGMKIDERVRKKHERKEELSKLAALFNFHGTVGKVVNFNSPQQMQTLLFEDWRCPTDEIELTETGDLSVGDASLRTLLASKRVSPEHKYAIKCVRIWKKADKQLNSFIRPYKVGAISPRGKLLVTADGWCHPDYNVHGAVTGRFSSSSPNFQQIPSKLKDIFIAPDGYLFVGADYDQLELRGISGIAGCKYYLDALERGHIDIHNLTGELIFGEGYYNVEGAPSDHREKGAGAFKKRRDLVKTLTYASLYAAEAKTIHRQMTRAEDREGNLLYADLTVPEVRILHRRWLDAMPEIVQYWANVVYEFRHQGYLAEPVLGRRRYFFNNALRNDEVTKKNEIVNFKIQAGGTSVVHLGMLELVEAIPFDFTKGIGMCNQCHDSVLYMVPEGKAEEVKELMTRILTRREAGIPVLFSAEASIGKRWSDT